MTGLETQVTELALERLRVVAQSRISRAVLDDASIQTVMDLTTDSMLVRLRATILGHKLVDEDLSFIVDYPATWWDALKRDLNRWAQARWALAALGVRAGPHVRWVRWWLRRHPIREDFDVVRVRFTEHATFPEIEMIYPKQLGPVHVLQQATVEYEPHRAAPEGGYIAQPYVEPRRIWPHEKALADGAIKALAAIEYGHMFTPNLSAREAIYRAHEGDPEMVRALIERMREEMDDA